jgi:hypothetical protein
MSPSALRASDEPSALRAEHDNACRRHYADRVCFIALPYPCRLPCPYLASRSWERPAALSLLPDRATVSTIRRGLARRRGRATTKTVRQRFWGLQRSLRMTAQPEWPRRPPRRVKLQLRPAYRLSFPSKVRRFSSRDCGRFLPDAFRSFRTKSEVTHRLNSGNPNWRSGRSDLAR